MQFFKKDLIKLFIFLSIFFVIALKIENAPFFVPIANFIKTRYWVIMVALYLFFCCFFLKKMLFDKKWFVYLSLALVLFFGSFIFLGLNRMFISDKRQYILNKYEGDVYLVRSYAPFPGVCTNSFSIQRKRGLFMKMVYEIGCRDYTIKLLNSNEIKIIMKSRKSIFNDELEIDSAIVRF